MRASYLRQLSDSAKALSELQSKLVPGIDTAFDIKGCTLAFTTWRPIKGLSLLAAQMQLEWSGRGNAIPINALWASIPCWTHESRLLSQPIFNVQNVFQIRNGVRVTRYKEGSRHPKDLQLADWEFGVDTSDQELLASTLGANAFISVDRVGNNGKPKRGSRPVFGHRAKRDAFRPRILLPAFGASYKPMCEELATADILLVDLQYLRAPKAIETVVTILNLRGKQRPTLIVAQSPSELLSVWHRLSWRPAKLLTVHEVRPPEKVEADLVGKERLLLETPFKESLAPLKDMGREVQEIITLANHAWWEGCHILFPYESRPALETLDRELQRLSAKAPAEARFFHSARALLTEQSTGPHVTQRLSTVCSSIEESLTSSHSSKILILCRNEVTASLLRKHLCYTLTITETELLERGIRILPAYPAVISALDFAPDITIVCGYFGPHSIDSALAAKPKRLIWTLDPVEGYVAHKTVERQISLISALDKDSKQLLPLLMLRDEFKKFQVNVEVSTPIEAYSDWHERDILPTADIISPSLDEAKTTIIQFADGTSCETGSETVFDVIDEMSRPRRCKARDLEPGIEIIQVYGEHRKSLSELLLEVMDEGPFRASAEQRKKWFLLVEAMIEDSDISVAKIRKFLFQRGHDVGSATIKTWLPRNDIPIEDLRVPKSFSQFTAFADALGITFPHDVLKKVYRGIREWRIQHRRMGRQLARTMQLVASENLDAVSAANIQEQWGGIAVADLLEGTRIVVVDSVINLGDQHET